MVTFTFFLIVLSAIAWFGGPRPNRSTRRRWWAVLLLSLVQLGCSSMQRVDATPEDLQAQIRAGKYLQKGHDVTIFTIEGKELWFRFQRIENDAIVGGTQLGEPVSVPIADVSGVKTSRLNVGRTAALVGGGYLLYVVTILALLVIAF